MLHRGRIKILILVLSVIVDAIPWIHRKSRNNDKTSIYVAFRVDNELLLFVISYNNLCNDVTNIINIPF